MSPNSTHPATYLAEFDYRYSTRKAPDAERTVLMIHKTVGKRLTTEILAEEPSAVSSTFCYHRQKHS